MIVFNGREMKSPYSKDERRVVEINSTLSLQEVIDTLISGEAPNPDKVSVTNYEYDGPDKLTFYENTDTTDLMMDYYMRDEDEAEALFTPEYVRPVQFSTLESFQFGQTVAVSYETRQLTPSELLYELKAAIGTLPTLMDDSKEELASLTYDDLVRYNALGRQLIVPTCNIGSTNPSPSLQEIDHFASLNDYEKRLVTSRQFHPYKLFKIIEGIKREVSPNYIFSTDITNYCKDRNNVRKSADQIIQDFKDGKIGPKKPDDAVMQIVNDAFTREFNFIPRVASEYISGCAAKDDIDTNSLVNRPDDIEKYAKAFSRTSVTSVARTKNPYLLAVSGQIAFGNMPARIIDILAVYLNQENINKLAKKDFFPWLSAHAQTNPAKLQELIEKVSLVKKYTLSKDADTLLSEAKNQRGIADYKKFREDPDYQLNGQPMDFSKNELAIKGRHVVARQGNMVMRMLPPTDYANFTVGYDTCCCQHFGDAGESCTFKAVTDPFAGIVVVEENGKVKAQGFVWTDEQKNTLVFDNVEFAGNNSLDTQLAARYRDLFYEWVKASPYKNVHVGVGYNAAMNGWGKRITSDEKATLPTTIDNAHRTSWGNRNCYSDYNGNAKALKSDGQMRLTRTSDTAIEVEIMPDEPTRWDVLTQPGLSSMINDCSKTIEERIAFAEMIKNNPTAQQQLEAVTQNPDIIRALDNIDRNVQLHIMNNMPDFASLIKNPIPEIQYAEIAKKPDKILDIENPDEMAVGIALEKKGNLLRYFPHTSSENITKALTNDGMAIQFLPRASITPEMEIVAVTNNPRSVTLYSSPSTDAVLLAIRNDPALIGSIDNPSFEVKLQAVSANPALIFDIKNPRAPEESEEEHNAKVKQLWDAAVRGNGYLIRNCGKSFPDLREVAIRQTPFAVTVLPDATREEITLAVRSDPKVYMFFKNEEFKSYAYEKAVQIYGERNVPKKNIYEPPTQEDLDVQLY